MTDSAVEKAAFPFAGPLCDIAPPLLCWYDSHARRLPWRDDPSPYRVWISEVMLQQTRVEAVLPFFERFVTALPDVRALANADDALLLKLWEGLGYYSRARNLKRAAQNVVERHGGVLPPDLGALRALPGIGDYSAGAIGSIVFGIRACAVDGNVLRVISRLLASGEDIARTPVKQKLTALVRQALPQRRVGDFNQALMELGATVCLPNGAPQCGACPLCRLCEARRLGIERRLPVKSAKAARRVQQIAVFLITVNNKTVLRLRPPSGLLAGLWELPNAEGVLSAEQAAEQLEAWGISPCTLAPKAAARHVFTHIEWRMRLWRAAAQSVSLPEGWALADDGEIAGYYALPSAFSQFLQWKF